MIVLVGECELPGKKRKKVTEYTAQQVGTQLINHNADLASSFLPIQSHSKSNPVCITPQSINQSKTLPSALPIESAINITNLARVNNFSKHQPACRVLSPRSPLLAPRHSQTKKVKKKLTRFEREEKQHLFLSF